MTGERDSIFRFVPEKSYPLQGNVYAWGKTARLMTESTYFEVRDQIKNDFFAVDLCSSFPYFREIMTGQHKEAMHTEARKVVGGFTYELQSLLQRSKFRSTAINDKTTLKLLHKELAPKHSLGRELLTAPIFEIMANPPPSNKRSVELISNALFEKFINSDKRYEFIYEPTGKPGDKGTWEFIAPINTGITLQKIIEPILGSKTEEFIKNASSYLAEKLVLENKLRKITFLSLDNVPLSELIENAKNGFPPRLQNTLFFQSVQKQERHICSDIRSLQFKKNGVGFFSSIEGWPYYGNNFSADTNLDIARRISSQLAPGGKAVFFPWNMQKNQLTSQDLLFEIEKQWLNLGLSIATIDFTAEKIALNMTDRELMLANHSPILQQTGLIRSLILSKPIH